MRGRILFVIRVDPADERIASEVLSELLTFAAFDVPVSVLVLDRAARLLSKEISPALSGMMASLDLYGIKDIFVERESLEKVGNPLNSLPDGTTLLDQSEVALFFRRYDSIYGS